MRVLWSTSTQSGVTPEERQETADQPGRLVETVTEALEAIEAVRSCAYDAVVGEFPTPGWTADEWLEEIRRANRQVPIIIRCPGGTHDDAVACTKSGAYHFLAGESTPEKTWRILNEAVEFRRLSDRTPCSQIVPDSWKQFLVGDSVPMREIEQIIRMIAPRRCTVLITGETGTGKEMVARAIHLASGRGSQPLTAVNCNALPEALLEAELFGHVRGAFTGAISHRIGRFEQANHSTLFLDEIGDMPVDLQAKLLRVVQEREIQRLGSSDTVRLDVRVVAASNVDLAERIREGSFREDLFYRLNVVPIRVPPLRDRPEDVPLLALHFVDKICRLEGIAPKEISRSALDRLSVYPWPGNVRQLENAVEMAIALSGDREELTAADFPLPSLVQSKTGSGNGVAMIRVPDGGLDFERTVTRIERSILEQALERTRGNKKQAAQMLRLKRTTLSAKLKSLAEAV